MDQLVKFGANIYRIANSTTFAVWHGFSTMASNNKSPRLMKKIGTHSGVFHCDEALACFMLKQLPDYSDAEIIRTRDPKILEECDIVVDVGGEYDPKHNRFDHHQRGFKETFHSVQPELSKDKYDNIVLSSAGLVYAHFGLDIITRVLAKKNLIGTSESIKGVFLHVYDNLIEEIDAIDNGVPMCTEGTTRYQIHTHLSRRVNRLNPAWNDTNSNNIDELFQKAVALVGSEFEDCVYQSFLVWWPAREIVKKSIEGRKLVDDSGKIMQLIERCAWKEHFFSLEEDMDIKGQIQFCIFSDESDNSWRVQGIPIHPESFICRTFLHEDWRGVRDEVLSNRTKEGAIEMAKRSLEATKQ
ncbi:hypothetical protein GWI33_019108 [Rhynchophorus ferrugineus]|uniref:Uncharacterized protein n=1 Tax=Rhynchophorus ferrugineus TaxID=354439 RepID=A0A834M4F3_RHYFE|nr:hypothetical protein GWI33_019108 [Rhynchophorus ferrugineus]